MKFISILRQDLNKTIINAGFVCAAFITTLLCFTAAVYMDMTNSKTYSVFEAIFTLDKSIILSDVSFSRILVFTKALSGYITFFMPIIVAFPFMVSFCAERNNGLTRFTITRTGRYRYYFSKFAASFLGGGLAVMLGVMLFGVACAVIFPSLNSYSVNAEDLKFFLPDSIGVTVAKNIISAFLIGAISTMPAFFLSSFCRNPYIITCLPFMLNYFWNTALNKIIANALEKGRFEIIEKITPYYPTSVMNLLYQTEFDSIAKQTTAFNVCYVAVLLLGFVLVMNLRTDKGA